MNSPRETVRYSLSAGNYGDGKSVCLWRATGSRSEKIARFQNDYAARLFAEEFDWPLSKALKARLYPEQKSESPE